LLNDAERFDAEVFHAISKPADLVEADGRDGPPIHAGRLREALTRNWRRVFETTSHDVLAEVARPWLDAHAELEGSGRTSTATYLAEVLVAACDDRVNRLESLFSANRGWYAASGDQRRTYATARAVQSAVLEASSQGRSAHVSKETTR
jgi:hypothetical protein